MPEVIFLPDGAKYNAVTGMTLLDVALENDVELEHNCGGVCACSTCSVTVKSGMDNFPLISEEEEFQLKEGGKFASGVRLACQCRFINDEIGDVIVEILK